MLARRSGPAARPRARHHADHTTFRCITPILASRFTVYAMDRRADLALQASARTSNLSRLVLYEPGGGGDADPTNVQARLETLIAASEREAALVLVFREVAGLSDAEIN